VRVRAPGNGAPRRLPIVEGPALKQAAFDRANRFVVRMPSGCSELATASLGEVDAHVAAQGFLAVPCRVERRDGAPRWNCSYCIDSMRTASPPRRLQLSVFYEGVHIPGSPFFVPVVIPYSLKNAEGGSRRQLRGPLNESSLRLGSQPRSAQSVAPRRPSPARVDPPANAPLTTDAGSNWHENRLPNIDHVGSKFAMQYERLLITSSTLWRLPRHNTAMLAQHVAARQLRMLGVAAERCGEEYRHVLHERTKLQSELIDGMRRDLEEARVRVAGARQRAETVYTLVSEAPVEANDENAARVHDADYSEGASR
jgi:hypothetical protein